MTTNPTIKIAFSWQGPTISSGEDYNFSVDRLHLNFQGAAKKFKVLIPHVSGNVDSYLEFLCKKNDQTNYVELLSLKASKMTTIEIVQKSSLDFAKEPGKVGELGFNRSTSKRGLTISKEKIDISLPETFEEGKLYCITIQSKDSGNKLFLKANLNLIENSTFDPKYKQDFEKYTDSEITDFLDPLLSQLAEQYLSFTIEHSSLKQWCKDRPSSSPIQTFIQTLFKDTPSKKVEILALIRKMRSDVRHEETLSKRSNIHKQAITTFLNIIGNELITQSCTRVFESSICPQNRETVQKSIEQNVTTLKRKIDAKYLTHLPPK